MNYRHAFQAGNFADVLKHLVLALVLVHMRKKAAPFHMIDTNAGCGLYNLASIEAENTGEWCNGTGRLLAARDCFPGEVSRVLAPYLDLMERGFRTWAGGMRELVCYLGGPLIARRLMRDDDVLIVNELHTKDPDALAELFHRDRQSTVLGLDGCVALKALLPPK